VRIDLMRGLLKEMFEMWKAILNAVVESLVCVDPMAYMCYLQAKRETQLQAEAMLEQSGNDAAVIRLVERIRVREEARA
jgi:hypothetical protein